MHEAKLMNGKKITVRSDKGFIAADIMSSRIRGRNDINAMASKNKHSVCEMVWNYHDTDTFFKN